MIDKQRQLFKEYAIMTDFDKPYITMNHAYEINQLKIFSKLIENGLLSQQLKPVWWGCDTQTALAEAELSTMTNTNQLQYMSNFRCGENLYKYSELKGHAVEFGKLKLLIWTSTPWTIPLNRAICVNENMTYTLTQNVTETLVVAKSLAASIEDRPELQNCEY